MNHQQIDNILEGLITSSTTDRLRVVLKTQPNILLPLKAEINNLIANNNINYLKSSKILPFAIKHGLFDIVEEIIKYYDVSEIENIKPEAKSYDNFAKKYNKNVPNELKFKVGMQIYIETYLTEYSNALTAREVILSLSLPHKREKPVERLYPEIISNILSYHQNKEENVGVKKALPKYLRKYTRGGTKTKARSKKYKTQKYTCKHRKRARV